MKIKFKKIMSVIGSAFLVGSTIGMAVAAGGAFPSPFIKNNVVDTAIIYGTGSAASDLTAANAINTYLKTFEKNTTSSSSSTTTYSASGDFSESEGIRDNEIPLGGLITVNDIPTTLADNKISTLFDGEIKWDDGEDTKRYDLHEVISISNGMKTQTTIDNEDLNSSVVLENDQALTYKLIFDDAFDLSRIGDYEDGDADELYLTILGKEYEVIKMDSNSITVSLAEQMTVEVGGSFNVDGTILTVEDIFDDTVQINGKFIKEERTKTVDGIKIYVENIGYHSLEGYTNKVMLKVGKDIEKEFEDGDEYIEDDETWEWTIENPGEVDGWIGVKYVKNSVGYDDDDDEDNAIRTGQSYVFPENYAAVAFNGLTDVDYEDFELSFDDKKLYFNDGNDNSIEDVAILEGENDESFKIGGHETDSLYFKYNGQIGTPASEDYDSTTDPVTGTPASEDYAPANVKVYFKDINGDIDDDNEGRIQYFNSYDFDNSSNKTYPTATLIVDDTELDVELILDSNFEVKLTLTATGVDIKIPLGHDGTDFDRLGDDDDDADSTDLIVNGKDIGTYEEEVMDHYGIIYDNPEYNADRDKVIFSVPSEQVYADISVLGQGMEITNVTTTNQTTNTTTIPEVSSFGAMVVKDSEINKVKDKNLIIVGGSCINAEAAKILGGKACGQAFTLKTGIIAGKALVNSYASPYDANKVAVVVAGYNAADTTKAVNNLINSNMDLSVGQTYTI